MIEERQNIKEVTERHKGDVLSSRESFQRDVSEGRIVVSEGRLVGRSWQGNGSDGSGALAVAGHEGPGDTSVTSTSLPTTATEFQPNKVSEVPADPETAWRYTRLAITAGLVVLLLVVWIWQKRAGR